MASHLKHGILFLILAVAVTLTGQPAAADGIRYRDEVFPSPPTVAHDIDYGQAIDEYGQPETLYLDLYQPVSDTEPLRPAFVWIHGGGFTGGDKAGALDVEIATRFAKRGYVTTSINYRLREGEYFEPGDPDLPQAIFDAQHDAQASIRWLRANAAAYDIDPDRIAVGGTSAGAITALFVTYNSSDPGDSGNPGYPSGTSACVDVSGATAVGLMDAGEPPVLVVHGVEDTRVAYNSALAIVARAAEVGIPAEFHSLEGIGHGVWTLYKEDIILWMANFLYVHVIDPPPVGGIADHAQLQPNAAFVTHGSSAPNNVALAGFALGGALLLAAGGLLAFRRRGY